MKKIRLTESQFNNFIKKIIKEYYDENYIDPISISKTKAMNDYDWFEDAIEYVGGYKEWKKLTPEEKDQVRVQMIKSFRENMG